MKKLALLLAAGVFTFAACKKNDSNPAPGTGPTAKVMFMHGVITSDSIKVKVNDTLQSSVPSLYFKKVTPYTNLRAGSNVKLTFFNPANPGLDSFAIFQGITTNKNYSVFLAGGNAASKSVVFVEDDLSAPTSGMAKIRFVNLSPDPGFDNLTAVLTNTATTNVLALDSNISFKEVTPFFQVPAATYSVKIGKPSIFTFKEQANQQLLSGKIYTYVLTGIQAVGTNELVLNPPVMNN